MFCVYIVTILTATAFAQSNACKDGDEIKTVLVKNPDYAVGNWSYIYHWDNLSEPSTEFQPASTNFLICPDVIIQPAALDFVKDKLEKCSEPLPFKIEDAKLMFNAPWIAPESSIIFMAKENWMMAGCKKMIKLEISKVSEDVMVMISPLDTHFAAEVFSRKPLRVSEINCLARNVDVGKGMNGIRMCR